MAKVLLAEDAAQLQERLEAFASVLSSDWLQAKCHVLQQQVKSGQLRVRQHYQPNNADLALVPQATAESALRWVASGHAAEGKEVRWKILAVRARLEGRLQLMGEAARACEPGQRWRVWLDGAKVSLLFGCSVKLVASVPHHTCSMCFEIR